MTPGAQAAAVRRAIQEVDPTQAVSAVKTLEQYVGDALARPRHVRGARRLFRGDRA